MVPYTTNSSFSLLRSNPEVIAKRLDQNTGLVDISTSRISNSTRPEREFGKNAQRF
jgi:hypothetical protein